MQVTALFRKFNPIIMKWSTQFSTAEKQKLQEVYNLPEHFVKIIFSREQDHRDAITQKNRKAIGFKGAKLLVQKYYPEANSRNPDQKGNYASFEVAGQLYPTKLANGILCKSQGEGKESSYTYMSGTESEQKDLIVDYSKKQVNDEIEQQLTNDYESEGVDGARQGGWEPQHKKRSFEKVDCSGMCIYD